MVFVNPNSCECTNSELDLFAVQRTQTSIEEASVVEYHPISSLANRAPIDFDIPGSGEQYIDSTDNRWNKKLPSRISPDCSAIRRPRSPRNVVAESLIGPSDSTAIGWKM